jgi:acetyl-CoA synthetase
MNFKIDSLEKYQEQTLLAKSDPEKFWNNIAEKYQWEQKWSEVSQYDLSSGNINWFNGAKSNITINCLDRHLADRATDIALIWEPNDPKDQVIKLTYQELYEEVVRFASLLKKQGINKGDRVCIYMPMIVESVVAMLACARIGAIHSVVFAGFSAKALAGRIADCEAKLLITSDRLYRGNKTLNLLEIANDALKVDTTIEKLIIYKRSADQIAVTKPYIVWQEEILPFNLEDTNAVILDAEDPLFILYTSGSTGVPKGVVHHNAGYMVYAGYSFQNVFQYQANDIYFCTADIGWITGHTYMVYGPLLCAGTILMFEGVPTYPNPSRFWDIVEKHQVNILYTAPTAIRALMKYGDEFIDNYKLDSIKVLGTVGEPINQEAWQWYYDKVGKSRVPIVDTWWQTETGGILISALANITKGKATFASSPLPGINPIILDNDGKEITQANITGNLCFKQAWPAMIRQVWNNKESYLKNYFKQFPGYYFSGDGCFKSKSGYFRITGRVDDVINVSGHRIGTAEIENVINMHELVNESAVIGVPHEIKGEAIYAFVATKKSALDISRSEIIELLSKEIGNIAKPDKITFVVDLPKTRSGKIMRRILKKIVANDNDLGDISTLVNPEILDCLRKII